MPAALATSVDGGDRADGNKCCPKTGKAMFCPVGLYNSRHAR
jgi:hypothetical protein